MKNRTQNFGRSYLGNGWCNLLQLWNVTSYYRRSFPPQIWCSSDKRSRIYECVKIATFVIPVNILTPVCACPVFLGRTTHYSVSFLFFIFMSWYTYSTTVLYDIGIMKGRGFWSKLTPQNKLDIYFLTVWEYWLGTAKSNFKSILNPSIK